MADLFLHEAASGFDHDAELIVAKGLFGIDRKLVLAIEDWDELAKEIQKHRQIDRLVLHFHAFSGGMLVGGDGRELNEQSVIKLFDNPPNVSKIAFVGCHTGKAPTNMWTFAKLFSATSASGYTWTVFWQWATFNFPKGVAAKQVSDLLTPYEKMAVDMLPAPTVVATTAKSADRTVKTVLMYGSSDDSEAKTVPITATDRYHKPLKEAEQRNITSADAPKVERELLTSPTPPFQNVTVSA